MVNQKGCLVSSGAGGCMDLIAAALVPEQCVGMLASFYQKIGLF
jgi:hypothetical protein